LAIFLGPEAYVSPGFYPGKAEHGKVVPTWNYLAVHAYCQAEVFDEPERLLALVTRLTQRHEASREQPWSVSDAPADYIAGMLRSIVGFALPIARLEGKWKLSQNKPAADIAGVRDALAGSAVETEQKLAARMAVPSIPQSR
jgi:transcriptional regulator